MILQEAINSVPFVPTTQSVAAQILWLVPVAPMVAAGIIAFLKQPKRKTSATLAIGSMALSLLISIFAFAHVVAGWISGVAVRETVNFAWLHFGTTAVELGWMLDPLAAIMLVMVTFVGLLIFIYSTGYMATTKTSHVSSASSRSLRVRCSAWSFRTRCCCSSCVGSWSA